MFLFCLSCRFLSASLQGLPSCRGRQRWDHRCHRGLQLSKLTQIATNWKSPNASWCTHDVHTEDSRNNGLKYFKMVYTLHVLAFSRIILHLLANNCRRASGQIRNGKHASMLRSTTDRLVIVRGKLRSAAPGVSFSRDLPSLATYH